MVLPSKEASYCCEGKVNLLPEEVHGCLPGERGLFIAAASFEGLLVDGEVGRDRLEDLLVGDPLPVWWVNDIG